jgi:carbon storage regulator
MSPGVCALFPAELIISQEESAMLVLARKAGESIVIGDAIVVTVLQTNRKSIRLGIQAPAHVPISRQELPVKRSAAMESVGASNLPR